MQTDLRVATSAVSLALLAGIAIPLIAREPVTAPGRNGDRVSAPQPSEASPRSVQVPGNQQWTATNFTVRDGDRIQFTGTGEIQLSADPEDRASVAGSLTGRRAPRSPAPRYLAGALIGRIGGGRPFPIGDQTSALPMSGNGPLWLGVNDDEVGDNSGSFSVTFRLIRRGR